MSDSSVRVRSSHALSRITTRSLAALIAISAISPWSARGLHAQTAAPPAPKLSEVDEIIRSERFVAPPKSVSDAVLAPRWLNVTPATFNKDRRWFINEIGDGPVTMDVFSRPFHELGGLFVDFRGNRSRTLTIRNSVALELISATDGKRVSVTLPVGARVSNATWSPDGQLVAYYVHTLDATHIWVADLTGKAHQVTRTPVLATLLTAFDWTGDSNRIVTVLIPDARPAAPVPPAVPQGPRVKLAEESDKNHLRTYASLMATPFDQALLEWHSVGQLAFIDVRTRVVTKVGAPTMIESLDVAPDGKYIRVGRMTKPFSYLVPVSNFGSVDEIWTSVGKVVAKLGEEPLNLGVDTARAVTAPGAGDGEGRQPGGKREITWRPNGSGFTFLEQEPARQRSPNAANVADSSASPGDSTDGSRSRRKDRVMQWLPPFDSSSLTTLYTSDTRIATHRYSPDLKTLFLQERMGQTTHEYAVILSDPTKKYTLARYRNDDVYANPGLLVMAHANMPAPREFFFGPVRNEGDRSVQLSPDGESVYLYGTKYDKSPLDVGPKSFIDRVAVRTGQKTRIYESENNAVYEKVIAFQDLEGKRLIVSREGETAVTQSYLRSGDQLAQITQNKDYTPDLTAAPKENFIVERPDGFKFKVNVTLPPGYQKGTKLPAMFWFYPREFAGQDEYDRGARTYNKNAFNAFNPRSMQFLVRLGYAVVEPDTPIVGSAGQWNNNYENDLRNNLAAVIDEVDRRGLVDRTRIAIGGHSYGAFSTVNAMVHTPFFKAGIAGDGNYNRTLTPLDFQSERRQLWDAKDTYLSMSPILYANNLTGALLMYHGLGDQNVGTEPSNSPRLFHALNGLGKTASMYLYPFEDHGPATKETLLDLWARWSAWLDKYVKNASPKAIS
ncbi:MAG: prolyl oligopeptidase family serine peptidase [Gemmatimonadaceae bacterium]